MLTDAIIMSVSAKKVNAVKAVSELRFNQLHALRRTYELPDDLTQPFINFHVEMSHLTSDDPVFRFSENGVPLQGKYQPHERCRPSHPSLILA